MLKKDEIAGMNGTYTAQTRMQTYTRRQTRTSAPAATAGCC